MNREGVLLGPLEVQDVVLSVASRLLNLETDRFALVLYGLSAFAFVCLFLVRFILILLSIREAQSSHWPSNPMVLRPDVEHVGPTRAPLTLHMFSILVNLVYVQILQQFVHVQLGSLAQRHWVVVVREERVRNVVVGEVLLGERLPGTR